MDLAILESLPDALLIVDDQGVITVANGNAQRLFGYTGQEFVGKPIEILLPARFRVMHQVHRGAYQAAPRSRPMGLGLDLAGLRHDGTEFPAEISLAPITVDGRPCTIAAIRDVAERRKVEERARLWRKAQEEVRERDEFLSIASHELRTPLTSLQLQVQSLLRMLAASGDHLEPGADPGAAGGAGGAGYAPRMEQKLKTVSRSTERLSELVNRLLDVSRITSGNPMHLDLESFDLAELVREVVARFGDALRERRSEVRIHAPNPVPGTWDRMRVDTVVTNLLSNAIKYGEGRPIEVEVTREGDAALLAVRDHGIGIHPDDQARIFGRFERAVPERHYGGFGIGLWVARLVAEAHGGKLRVSSAPGAGATFTLELPPKPPAPELVPDLVPGTAPAVKQSVPGTLKEAAGATEQRSVDGKARTGETS